MTINVVSVPPETPLKEVGELLADRRISGMPVVDGQGRVLGVVSEAAPCSSRASLQSGGACLRGAYRPGAGRS